VKIIILSEREEKTTYVHLLTTFEFLTETGAIFYSKFICYITGFSVWF